MLQHPSTPQKLRIVEDACLLCTCLLVDILSKAHPCAEFCGKLSKIAVACRFGTARAEEAQAEGEADLQGRQQSRSAVSSCAEATGSLTSQPLSQAASHACLQLL